MVCNIYRKLVIEACNSEGESPGGGLHGILQSCYVCIIGQFRGHIGEQAHEQVHQHCTAEEQTSAELPKLMMQARQNRSLGTSVDIDDSYMCEAQHKASICITHPAHTFSMPQVTEPPLLHI